MSETAAAIVRTTKPIVSFRDLEVYQMNWKTYP